MNTTIKAIQKDLALAGWRSECKLFSGIPVLFITFVEPVRAEAWDVIVIQEVIKGRAQMQVVNIGTFYSIIISK